MRELTLHALPKVTIHPLPQFSPACYPHLMNLSNPPLTATEPWLTQTFREGLSQLGVTLSDDQVRQLQVYERELESWNRRFNLTRITGRERVQTFHFLDSLTAVLAIPPEIRAGGRVIDVATGAGFPGIPLKIALPGLRLTLVDSVGKKATFLEHLLDALELPDVQLLLERAETLAHEPENRDSFDVALARGLAPMRILAELTLPFCRPGGIVVAHKKGDVSQELEDADNAITTLGGRLSEVQPVNVTGLEDNRALVVVEKISPTPARYPRRPGIPKKRPL